MVQLVLAEEQDFNFFYEIKADADNLFWCGYKEKPIRQNLINFWKNNINKKNIDRDIYIIKNLEIPIGYIYIYR